MKKNIIIICAIIVVISIILALFFILKPQKSEPAGTGSVSSQNGTPVSSVPVDTEQSSSQAISSVINGEFRFQGRVIDFIEGYALIETFPSSANYPVSDKVYISTAIGPSLRVGTRVEVVHGDGVMMSNPPRIGNILSITLIDIYGNPIS